MTETHFRQTLCECAVKLRERLHLAAGVGGTLSCGMSADDRNRRSVAPRI